VTESLNAAVLRHVERGWPVLPCHPVSKRPLSKYGFHDAAPEPQQIVSWSTNCPKAMIAVTITMVAGPIAIALELGAVL
jgi:hypothetical protein